tara:strand:- start:57 stop:566 length:510 start_codon:yes stop_codon:yes gene_type:complete
MNKISTYSNTFFNIANENHLLDQIMVELGKIKYLYKTEPNFRLLFESKRINSEIKKTILKNVLSSFENVIVEFLCILIEQKCSKYLIQIIDKFIKLSKKAQHAHEIEVITANQLDENLINELSRKLNCTIKTTIDKSMIGGIKLRKGNTIFDNSISFQINNLKKTLYNV